MTKCTVRRAFFAWFNPVAKFKLPILKEFPAPKSWQGKCDGDGNLILISMETIVLTTLAIVTILAIALTALGQRNGWGVTPLSLLGLGFLVPFGMLLGGII